tara:strand:+ start:448 stop:645 length:198 start_codon:yes stop_codon:yes gene_type:complete
MSRAEVEVFEGEEFACQNYNISRDEFCSLAFAKFRPMSLAARAAVETYDTIQKDLEEYDEYLKEK